MDWDSLAVEMDQSVALVNTATETRVRAYTNLGKFISFVPDYSVLKCDLLYFVS